MFCYHWSNDAVVVAAENPRWWMTLKDRLTALCYFVCKCEEMQCRKAKLEHERETGTLFGPNSFHLSCCCYLFQLLVTMTVVVCVKGIYCHVLSSRLAIMPLSLCCNLFLCLSDSYCPPSISFKLVRGCDCHCHKRPQSHIKMLRRKQGWWFACFVPHY